MRNLTVFLAVVSIISSLQARENPFVPVNSAEDMGKATQIKEQKKSFDKIETKLPSTARILKKLELHYQNLDGSIQSKVVEIDEKIDWHNPLLLQVIDTKMQEAKPQTLPQKNIIISQKIEPAQEHDFKGILKFKVQNDQIFIETKDRRIRHFLVSNPYKIVIDFEREIDFYTKSIEVKEERVDSVTFGKHSGYYRMAIELDGQYRYDLQESKEGFVITLR